jgi:hypothetical protein
MGVSPSQQPAGTFFRAVAQAFVMDAPLSCLGISTSYLNVAGETKALLPVQNRGDR